MKSFTNFTSRNTEFHWGKRGLEEPSVAPKVSGFIFKGGYFVLFDSVSRQFDRPAGL
jgi:hypothetical protein